MDGVCCLFYSEWRPPFYILHRARPRATPSRIRACRKCRPCLAGLQERLQAEPCQTVVLAPAPGLEPPLEPLAASTREEEPGICGSTRHRPPLASLALGWGSSGRCPQGRRGPRRHRARPAGTRWPAARLAAWPAGWGRGGRQRAYMPLLIK